MPIAASSAASAATLAALTATATGPATAPSGFWLEVAKGLPAAFVALVIGLIAAGIAWRQARIAGAKLKLDLFDRRFKLYVELRDFLEFSPGECMASMDPSDLGRVHPESTSAHFLFGAEIGRYVADAHTHATDLRHAMQTLRRTDTADPDRAAVQAQVVKLLRWFESEQIGLRSRFAKYMDFEEWH